MIQAIGLTKSYGEKQALCDLSFSFDGKGIHGILAPNGGGKSTLARILGGIELPTGGQLLAEGQPLNGSAALMGWKRRIGYMPTDLTYYADMTLFEFLTFVGGARGVDSERLFRQTVEALRLAELEEYSACLLSNLRLHQKKRLALASTLIGNPELLILDEPTAGLAEPQAVSLRELIRMLGTKKQILLFSHDSAEVTELCSDVLMLSRGRQVLFDTVAAVSEKLNRNQTILVTVRARNLSADAVISSLSALPGVLSCAGNGTVPEGISLKLEAKPDPDRQRQIRHAVEEQGGVLGSFETRVLTLTDVYLALTEPEETPAPVSKKRPTRFGGKENAR